MDRFDVHIQQWIEHISKPREEIGKYPVCPFSKAASYDIIATEGHDIDPPKTTFDVVLYILPDVTSELELATLTETLNRTFPDYIFLSDHRNRTTHINGVQTNNGMYNLILCQWRVDLEKAREKLSNTKYYSFWDPDYLNEILSSSSKNSLNL